jgi:hypothetical protein
LRTGWFGAPLAPTALALGCFVLAVVATVV